jgi:hypothetical protein
VCPGPRAGYSRPNLLGLGEDRLSIYLNDHLAGATVGVRLARRIAGDDGSTGDGEALDAIAAEIAQDRATLIEVMRRLRGIDFDALIERRRVRAADEALA